ncbi:MAG: DUF4175 family protein [Bacteroidia bacterium]
MQGNYPLLIKKLDEFIRKFYRNQLIRGGIYFLLAVLVSFLFVIVLEYFGRYNSAVRAILFYSLVSFTAFCLVRFVIIPLTKLFHLGKIIDHTEASKIIGKHFPEVKDKLLNALQLKSGKENLYDKSLIEAAIDQKSEQLKPVPFSSAIDLKKNIRYAKYVLVPVGIYGLIFLVSPGMITDSTERIIKYNRTFKIKAPFDLSVENKKLEALQFSDFELNVKVSGSEIPEEVFVLLDGNQYKMEKKDKLHFVHTFGNLQKTLSFQLFADKYFSDDYKLEVLAKPLMLQYQVRLEYPAYTGQKNETINNPGDLTIPAGTVAQWKFITKQTDELILGFEGAELKAEQKEKNLFIFSKKFFLSGNYFIKNKNAHIPSNDSMLYSVTVVPDAFPLISVEEKTDSLTGKQVYFIGDASDDYGLTKLTFNYRFVRLEAKEKQNRDVQSKSLAVEKREKNFRFYHQFDLNEVNIAPSDELEYYFEVWDNDGVHGPKSSRSKTMVFKAPSMKELETQTEAGNSALKEKMKEALRDAQRLQKELKELELKMLEKKELTWEEKKKMEELLEKQKQLDKKIEDILKENKKLNEKEAEYKKQNENILEKEKQLEKMFNEVMNDEMKKLIQQLEKMVQQQNKDQIKQDLEKMKMSDKDVEKELDRMLEQFKHLELEKKLQDATEKLDKLSDKQSELSEKNEKLSTEKKISNELKNIQNDSIKKSQEDLKKQFEDLKKDLGEIDKKNSELQDPEKLENTEQEQKQTDEEMKNAGEEMKKGNNKSAAKNQKNAAKEMKNMSEKIRKGIEDSEKKEMELDLDALREILENTIQLSKDQEELMERMKQINSYNPQYVDAGKDQKKMKDNAKIIEDSLLQLSKRVAQIRSFINREVTKMSNDLDKSIAGYGSRNFGEIRTRQQYAMTHANNLAVMLSDVLQQMQTQLESMKRPGKEGKGTKGKKGQGNGAKGNKCSFGSMKKMQEELNKQIREGMNKNGTSPGDKEGKGDKPGEKNGQGNKPGKQGQNGMGSEEFARMAAQQMAVRQQLQKMMREMGTKEKDQFGGGNKLNELQKLMEETEKELFNKRLSGELLMRQQEILTRLLESEKAERKQEQEEKREAEKAKEKPRAVPPDFEKYIKQKGKEKELLETIPADMQPYYKEKAKEYFNKIGDGN